MSPTKKSPYSGGKNNITANGRLLDQSKLTQILPEEVWHLIFKSYVSSVDLSSMARASQYFEDLLFPLRSHWLFPLVWRIILAKQVVEKNRYAEWFNSLLTLRWVCKTWNKTIDGTIELFQMAPLRKCGNVWLNDNHRFWKVNRLNLDIENINCAYTKAGLNKFLQHFESTHAIAGNRSPLVSKTVKVYSATDYDSHVNSTRPACLNILSAYGKFFKHCSVNFDHYDEFCRMLAYMPNLETAVVYYMRHFSPEKMSPNELAEWSRHDNPKLPRLKYLEVRRGWPNFAINFVESCTNLSSFICRHNVFDLSKLKTDQLKQLRVLVDLPTYTTLKTMSNSWALVDLELRFEENCFVEWPELFDVLRRNWNSTLKRFRIELHGGTHRRHIEQIVNWSLLPLLNLSNLTHLALDLQCAHTFDFILPLQDTLEFLSLNFEYDLINWTKLIKKDVADLIEKQTFKVFGYLTGEHVYKSNVWKVFPKLKELQFLVSGRECKVFSRSQEGTFGEG